MRELDGICNRECAGVNAKRPSFYGRASWLLAQTQPLNQAAVAVCVLALQVVQQLAPLADHSQETAAGMMILDVGLEMAGQLVDARRQQGDLHFRGTGVALGALVIVHDLRFVRSGEWHANTLLGLWVVVAAAKARILHRKRVVFQEFFSIFCDWPECRRASKR